MDKQRLIDTYMIDDKEYTYNALNLGISFISLAQILYVCRDPRDVCVSYYFHSIKLDGYKKEFSDFVDLFLTDMCKCLWVV